jgi:hypothetical protein
MTAETFDFDTSGVVKIPAADASGAGGRTPMAWSDLSPFAQGYIRAAFADWHRRACVLPYVKGREWPHFEAHERQDFPVAFTDATGARWDIVRHGGQWKRTDCQTPGEFPAFSDLHPDTLASMLADCERFLADPRCEDRAAMGAENGKVLWAMRQLGAGESCGFPKLTLSLDPNGKVIAHV